MNTYEVRRLMSRKAELARHIRGRLKHENIRARVKSYESCGLDWISIDTPKFDELFTEQEQGTLLTVLLSLKLLRADRRPIDTTQMTYTHGGHFIIPPQVLDQW